MDSGFHVSARRPTRKARFREAKLLSRNDESGGRHSSLLLRHSGLEPESISIFLSDDQGLRPWSQNDKNLDLRKMILKNGKAFCL
jgi:hypothetical protein